MSMKNNLVNWKLPLLKIIYIVICITLIRYFTNFNTTTYNSLKQRNSKIIVAPSAYTITHSNKLPLSMNSLPNSNQVPTLSRGYIEKFNTNSTNKLESCDYENDLYTSNESALIDSYYVKKALNNPNSITSTKRQVLNAHLPNYLMYKKVHVTNLKEFLKSKNSLLAEKCPSDDGCIDKFYYEAILSVSEDFNLNPLLMFAITGQEQSFVPKSSKNANKIANNPFNVFGSWKKYNTNIQDAATIAARTVVNLCKDKPNNMDAFTWINRKYSEDKNWSKAVRSIFKELENNVSYYK